MQPLETYTICRTLQMIDSGNIRIPILQRDYVWNKDDVEKLFCSIYKEGVVCEATMLKITNTDKQIFDSRPLKKDIYERIFYGQLQNQTLSNDNPLYLVLDGQQRLQSLYLGMTQRNGDFELYFNFTHNKGDECIFKYFDDDVNPDQWLSVKEFYSSINPTSIIESSTEYINQFDDNPIVKENLFKLYYNIFFADRYIFLVNYPNNDGNDEKRVKRFFVYTNHEYDKIKKWEDPTSTQNPFNELYLELDKMSKYLRNKKVHFDDYWQLQFIESLNNTLGEYPNFALTKACFKLLSFFPFVIDYHKGLLEELTNNQDIKSALVKYHHNQFKEDFDDTNSLALTYFYIYYLILRYKNIMRNNPFNFDNVYLKWNTNNLYEIIRHPRYPIISNSNKEKWYCISAYDLDKGSFEDSVNDIFKKHFQLETTTIIKHTYILKIDKFNQIYNLHCNNINDLVESGKSLLDQEWDKFETQFNRNYQPNIPIYD